MAIIFTRKWFEAHLPEALKILNETKRKEGKENETTVKQPME